MLHLYDRSSDWGLSSCVAGYDARGQCRQPEQRFARFPEALKAFLRSSGHLPAAPI
ncbi:MAG: hypothetical protein WBM08_01120 [Prochlorococcaceae cyanobacterium]